MYFINIALDFSFFVFCLIVYFFFILPFSIIIRIIWGIKILFTNNSKTNSYWIVRKYSGNSNYKFKNN